MLGTLARYCHPSPWEGEASLDYMESSKPAWPQCDIFSPHNPQQPQIQTKQPNQNDSRLVMLFTVFSFWSWSLLSTSWSLPVSNSFCLLLPSLHNFMVFNISERVAPKSDFRIKISWSTIPDPFVSYVYVCVCVMCLHVWAYLCGDTCATYVNMHLEARGCLHQCFIY